MKSYTNLYILLGMVTLVHFVHLYFIQDEEILVLGCWVVFVYFAFLLGRFSITAMFEERRVKYAEDILSSYTFQKSLVKGLINYYHLQISTISEVKGLFYFSKAEITRILGQRRDSFKSIIGLQIEQKLSILADKEGAVASQVQESIHSTVSENVLTLFKSKDSIIKGLKATIFTESMSTFEVIISDK